jgi:glutathione S-transferase
MTRNADQPIVLRYFPAQGRVQALRHALEDSGLPFEDVRVPLADWPPHKNERGFAGPFGALPTLTWGTVTIAETLPIATFIARRLGHYDGLDDEGTAKLEAVISCAYVDVMLQVGDILWVEATYPGADLAAAAPRTMARVVDKLERISKLIPTPGWFGGQVPTVADFFAAEALGVTRYLLGAKRDALLEPRMTRLYAHARAVTLRPAIQRARARRPPNFTASPSESSAIDRFQSLDLSSVGL